LEADLTVVPVTGLELGASGALTRPKFLVFQDAGGDERQTRFPYVPKESFNISATYSTDLPVGGLQLHAEYDWQGKTALSPDNVLADPYNADIVAATTRPAGGFVNARASLSILDKRVDLAVFVRNLANNRQVVEAFDLRDPIGLVHQTLADPRTFGGSVTVKFGPQ
jgi:iron complex outermembrane receptor protein